jgi:hypothetical protein
MRRKSALQFIAPTKLSVGVICIILLAVLSPCWAVQLILPESAYQGDAIVGRVLPPATVSVDGKIYTVSPKGYFVIGVPRQQKTDVLVLARFGNVKVSKIIRILAYSWQIQRVDGLPKRYVNPPPEALKQIKGDKEVVRVAREAKPHMLPLFLERGFIKPVKGFITGIFGSQRILNGQQNSPHWGVDFAAPMGEPVYSPADGIVSLVSRGMYLMGNTLMIDHGLGVRSIFIHLDSIKVKTGDYIKQGFIIAYVGRTGRATGPHLHWGVSVGTVPVDPARLTKKSFIIP